MKLCDIEVRKYKSLNKLTMQNLDSLVTMIGENSCGKSNILEALELFFTQFAWKGHTTNLTDDHWFRKDTSTPILFKIKIELNISEIEEIFSSILSSKIVEYINKNKLSPCVDIVRLLIRDGSWITASMKFMDIDILDSEKLISFDSLLHYVVPDFNLLNIEIVIQKAPDQTICVIDEKNKLLRVWQKEKIQWNLDSFVGVDSIAEYALERGFNIDKQHFDFQMLGYPSMEQIMNSLQKTIRDKMKVVPSIASPSISFMRQPLLQVDLTQKLIQLYQSGNVPETELWHDIHDRFGQSIPGEIRPVQGTLFFAEHRRRYPIHNIGSGYQNRLHLIWHLLTTKDSILLIEEPEAHLHPRLMHDIIGLIRDISDTNQVIMTTHSTSFLDQCDYREIWFIHKTQGETKARQVEGIDNLREIAISLGVKPSDVLMSNNILFVEGPSDAIVFKAMGRLLGVNLNPPRVSVIPMKGIGKEKYHLGVWTEAVNIAGIPLFVSLDGDKPAKEAAKELTTKKRGKPVIDKSLVYNLKKLNIEDYYPKKLLVAGIASKLKLSDSEIKSLKRAIKGKDRVKVIKAWLAKHDKDPDRIWKVAAAEYIKEHMELKDLKEELKDLLHRIDDIFKN